MKYWRTYMYDTKTTCILDNSHCKEKVTVVNFFMQIGIVNSHNNHLWMTSYHETAIHLYVCAS